MKLHLPKQLFTALLAAITLASPAAKGLTITGSGSLETITLNADEAYQGYNVTYTLGDSVGTLTKNGGNWGTSISLNFTLNDNAVSSCDSSTGLVYANTENNANIGLQLHDKDNDDVVELTGRWDKAYWNDSRNTYSEIVQGATYTLNLSMGNATSWTDGSNTTYTASGLNTSNSSFSNVVYNKTYVDTFEVQEFAKVTVSNAGGTWNQEFNREAVVNATSARYQIGGTDGAAAPDAGKTIVVGGSGQLFLQTHQGSDITLNNNIILGATTHSDGATYGTLRFGNDGGYTTTINGNITIVEDVLMTATTSNNAINLNGTVSGDYTLSLKGVGYNFADEVDIKGLNLEEGAEATFSDLTIDSTITGSGALKLTGALKITDISALDDCAYTYADGATSGFRAGVSAKLFGGTIEQGDNFSISITNNTFNVTNLQLTEGMVTGDYSTSNVYDVNEAMDYNAATMGTASLIQVNAAGSLTFAAGETTSVSITNLGNVNLAQGEAAVNINTLLGNYSNIANADGNITVSTTGVVSQSSNLAVTGAITVNGASEYKNNGNEITGSNLVLKDVASATLSGGLKVKNNLVLNGTNLTFSGDEVVDWGTSNLNWKVLNESTLNLDGTRQTFDDGFNLVLDNARVTGSATHLYGHLDFKSGATITVLSDSEINAQLRLRSSSVIINVADGKTLTISNTIRDEENYQPEDGGFTKSGTGTLILTAANTYGSASYGGTTISEGVLELQGEGTLGEGATTIAEGATLRVKLQSTGYTIANSITGDGTLVIANGGNATVNSNTLGVEKINTNIRIEDGGTLTFTGSGSDNLNYRNNSRTIYLKGNAKLDFDESRQTMGFWTVDMTGGVVSGTNSTASMDFHNSAFLKAHAAENASAENPTISSISANIRSKGNGTMSVIVDENAQLNMSGQLTLGRPTEKRGNGKLLVNGGTGVSQDIDGAFTISEGSVEFNGASISVGTFINKAALTVSGGTANMNGTVTNSGTITVSGGTATFANTLIMETGAALTVVSGGTANMNGSFNVTGTGVTVRQSGDGVLNLGGGIAINEGAVATFNGQVGIGSTITNNGTLTLNDSITIIGELSAFTQRGEATEFYQLADGTSSGNNGFYVVKGSSFWLTSEGSTGITNVAEGITTVQHDGNSYNLNQDNGGEGEGSTNNWYFQVASNVGKIYYVTSGDVVVDNTVQTEATDGYVLQGGNMQLTEGQVSTSAISYTSGTITLSDGAVLSVDSLTSMGVTANQLLSSLVSATPATEGATPTGKILISQSGLNTGDSGLKTAFTGKVELAENVTFTFGSTGDAKDGEVINTSSLAGVILNNGSVLKFQGTGDNDDDANGSSLSQFRNVEVNGTAEINLIDIQNIDDQDAVYLSETTNLKEGSNLKLTASYDGRIIIDNLKGSGALTSNGTTYTNNNSPKFYTTIKGLDDFTGTLNFTDTAGHTVSVSTGTASGGVSFAGLNMAGGTDVNNTFNVKTDTTVGTVTLSGNNNSINLSEGKSLSVGDGTVTNGSFSTGSAKVASKSADTPASLSHVKMTGSGFSAAASANGSKGSISNAQLTQLQADATFTIEDMTLTNTTISAATPTTQVSLQNVTVSNVVLAQGKFSTDAPMSVEGVEGAGGTAFSASTSAITEGSSITINARAGASLAVDLGDLSCVEPMGPGKYNLSITLNGVGFDSYENLAAGSGIIFAADSWLGKLLTAQGATAYVSGAVETPASVSEGGSAGSVSVSYSAATGSNVGTVITIAGLNVPEPASATLGLAALMMLCARRRRKA